MARLWRKWSVSRLVTLAFIVGCTIGIDIIVTAYVAHVAVTSCHRVQRLETIVVKEGQASLSSIGTRRSAAYAYYHEHPADLAAAKAAIRKEIMDFSPQPCSILG